MASMIELSSVDVETAIKKLAQEARSAVRQAGGYQIRLHAIYRPTNRAGEPGALAILQDGEDMPEGFELITGEPFPTGVSMFKWEAWLRPMVRKLPILTTATRHEIPVMFEIAAPSLESAMKHVRAVVSAGVERESTESAHGTLRNAYFNKESTT